MRPRYFIRVDDDFYPEPTVTMTVLCDDSKPQKVGLVDQHGHEIYRVSERAPIGFQPPKQRVRVKASSRRVVT